MTMPYPHSNVPLKSAVRDPDEDSGGSNQIEGLKIQRMRVNLNRVMTKPKQHSPNYSDPYFSNHQSNICSS